MLEIDIQRVLVQENVSTFISFLFGSLVSLSSPLFPKCLYTWKRTNESRKKKESTREISQVIYSYQTVATR